MADIMRVYYGYYFGGPADGEAVFLAYHPDEVIDSRLMRRWVWRDGAWHRGAWPDGEYRWDGSRYRWVQG